MKRSCPTVVSFGTGLGNSFWYLDVNRMAQISLNNDKSNAHLPYSECKSILNQVLPEGRIKAHSIVIVEYVR